MRKECRKCHEHKDLSTDFFPRNSASKDGFDSMCKACWKLRSAERSKSTPGSGKDAQVKITKASKAKAWEIVPHNVKVVSLERFADLPGDGVQFLEREGPLLAAIEEYRALFHEDPRVIHIPARFFIEVPIKAVLEPLPIQTKTRKPRATTKRKK